VAETNFRRAMENSVLTGMRALDLHGRITYVNAAFCQMTGWSERSWWARCPLPLLARQRLRQSARQLREELSGKTIAGGFQVRVRARTAAVRRAPVCLAADRRPRPADGLDVVHDRHHRAQPHPRAAVGLHERFTIVLEALDASVSVAPLGSAELLFANKLYRQWFGSDTEGHLRWWPRPACCPAPPAAAAWTTRTA
jgi:PAS domain S-box-containing protein